MKPMDKITLRLSPARQPGMTKIHLSGVISTRLSAQDVRRLWQLTDRLAEFAYVVLPVDVPLAWFDTWTARLERSRATRLLVRFVDSRRRMLREHGDQ
jgi:hypothetical protein